MSELAKLLYIEDDELDRHAFDRLIREKSLSWETTYAETLAQARSLLTAAHFDVIVSNHHLPDGEVADLLEFVQDTPFVLLMAPGEDQAALRALVQGGDYLPKDPQRRYLEALPLVVEKTLRRKRVHEKEQHLARQLRESEQRLRTTFENAASGIFRTDEQGRFVAVNDRLCQMLGYSREELLGMTVHDLTWPEDRPTSDDLNAQLREGRLPMVQYEKRYLKRDGSPLWVHVALSAARDEAGRYLYSVGMAVDISTRKAAEQQLRLQATALAAAPNAISLSTTDRKGTIIWVNQAFTELTGYQPEEVIGRTHHILSSGQQDEAFYRNLWETISRGEVWHGEMVNRRKDGTLYYDEMGITPLRDEDGNITHYVAVKQDITARKKAEAALAESHKLFAGVVNSALDAIIMIDGHERIVLFNPAAERMFGCSAQEALDSSIDRFIPARLRDAHREHIEAFQESRLADWPTGHPSPTIAVRADETEFPVEIAVSRVVADSSNLFSITVHDITERHRSEQALRDSEQRFRGTFENAAVGITHIDADGRWLRVNERFREILGRQCEELRGRSFMDFTHPEDIEPDASQHAALWRGEIGSYSVEKRYIRSDGQVVWTHVTRSLQRDENGQPLYSICIVEDITERKRTEAALSESEEIFRTLAENIQAGCGIIQGARFVYANPYLARASEYSVDELLLIEFPQLIHPDHRAMMIERARRRQAGEPVPTHYEFKLVTKSGQVRWLDYSAGTILYKGKPAIVGSGFDITDRKQALQALQESQRQLEEANLHLEQRVAQRTAEAEARAEQLRELAAELTRTEQHERQRMARVLHDHLQQLLVGAKFSTSILRVRLAEDEESLQHLQQVDDLLDQSIQSSRSLTVELSPPVLSERGLVPAMHWLAGWVQDKHGLKVQVEADEAIYPLDEDIRTLLFQSVRELLFNVVKHAKVEAATVRVERCCQDRMRVVVEDDGAGFDPSVVKQRRTNASTGLGLHSMQERLEAMDSRLEIESAPGKGTRMILVAPLHLRKPAPAAPSTEPAAMAAPGATTRPAGRPGCIRVLIADDHTVVRDGMSRLLATHADIEVVGTAADGQQAIELSAQLQPDVVIMDVAMPGLDGIEATRQLRRAMRNVCIVGLSMHGDDETALRMQEAGAAVYLTKTTPPQQLVAAIRACGRKT